MDKMSIIALALAKKNGGGGGGGAVNSVNGQTGTVVLSAADVGAQTPFHTTTLTIAVTDWETGDPSFIRTYFCGKDVNGMTNNALVFYEFSDPDADIGVDGVLNGMVFGTDTLPAGDITVKVAWFV